MRKNNKMFVFCCIAPAILAFLLVFAFPIIKICFMSLFNMNNASSKVSEWTFVGFGNFVELFNSSMFLYSFVNIGKIWLFGGVCIMMVALLLSVILTSGIRGKAFFKAVIYLPNIITAVAMANMWIMYVYNGKYGLLFKFFTALGMDEAAAFQWLAPENIFLAMLIAFGFGSIGYYMLIFTAGIEKIPADLYEAAFLDGSNVVQNFFRITLPLLRGVFRTALTLWTTNTLGFFVWSQMFSPVQPQKALMTPTVYMYVHVFGMSAGDDAATMNAGLGAAVCLLLMVAAALAFSLINRVIKDDKLEF